MAELLSVSSFTLLFGALFLGCMAGAAVYDLASYTIPNFLSLLLLAGFAALGAWQGFAWELLGSHFGAGMAMLAVGWLMYLFSLIGGGDAKFMAATAVWAGWSNMFDYILAFSLSGGLLVLLLMLFRRLPLSPKFMLRPWIAALHTHGNGVPYGVALAAGGYWSSQSWLFLQIT